LRIKTLILLFFGLVSLYGQFSPGDLSEAHKSLEGIDNCNECHALKKKVSNRKCVNCHERIKSLIDAKKGYHGFAEIQTQECKSCHSEHFGREFEIIHFDQETFNHDESGYQLMDAHKLVDCQKCHNKNNIDDNDLAKKDNTYLGLSTQCNDCHENIHKPTLGDDCSNCHKVTDFKSVEYLDHSKTNFQLTGQHKNLTCNKCHKTNKNKQTISFSVQNYNSCNSCHKDIHNKKFQENCSTCHVTESFNKILNNKKFNHNKTNYPLIGEHKKLNCNKCHKDQIRNKPIGIRCIDCHDDYHKGNFTRSSIQTDCTNCHSENGFTPSTFTIEKHNNLEFQLQGRHLAIPCENCHKKTEKWSFRNIGKKCNDCHKNIHDGYISTKYIKDRQCSGCHFVDSWNNINFNHDSTEFPLYGKHKSTSCKSCHFQIKPDGSIVQQFKYEKNNCIQCHENIHDGKFENNDGTTCVSCHVFDSWRVEKFNHEITKFSLTGVHEKTQCTKCHIKTNIDGYNSLTFAIENFKCSDCH
jgi:hypothetical protein